MTAPVILNVNDHPANLYMVSRMLRNAGYAVLEAATGERALDLARAHEPQIALVVLDIQLPDIGGLEVCRRIKADPRTREIKVLHTSAACTTTDNKVEGLEAGADGYLTQPFEPQDLIATVRSLIRLRQTEADLGARNELLKVANQRKDEFLAMLAHELRNPLAAIHLGIPMLERFPPRDPLEAKTLAAMRRQTQLLIQLVDDLLDTARVTQGRIELHVARVDLAPLVLTVCDGMRERLFTPRGQRLVVDVPPGKILVDGDAARLEQILTNLLDNASKYSDPDTSCHVSLAARDGQVELAIRDQGIGIDPALLPAMFELFTQGSASIDRSRGGLGIGLTLVKALVELHRGSITASSDGVGHGTEVRVRMPCVQTATEVPAATPASAPPGAFKIVVIDDNEDGRFMLRSLCELHGHEVTEAADGLEGVARTFEVEPDLAFVDIGLPGIDGYEVARRVRARFDGRSPYLVALSGYGASEHRAMAFAAGFDEHIAKPMALDQLAAVMSRARKRSAAVS